MENGGWKTEDRAQGTEKEDGRWRTGDGGIGDGGWRTDEGGLRTEKKDGGWKTENRK